MSTRKQGRPEHCAPPEVFYGEDEAKKYLTSSRMVYVQTALAERCFELLALDDDTAQSSLLLDLGCGTGLSGDVLSAHGCPWVGIDISVPMLKVASVARDVEGDLLARDLGDGLDFFRSSDGGVFDGAISVSTLQWLCNVDKKVEYVVRKRRKKRRATDMDIDSDQQKGEDQEEEEEDEVCEKETTARKRLVRFYTSLYAVLRRGARAVFQVYPENADQLELMTSAAMHVGFSGGVVVDFPNSSKAKKYYIVLRAGPAPADAAVHDAPRAVRSGSVHESKRERPGKRRKHEERRRGTGVSKTSMWVKSKKERQRRLGAEVRPDSKYTGRKRSGRF